MLQYLCTYLSRSIKIETVHWILQKSMEVLKKHFHGGVEAAVAADESLKANKKLIDNLYKAAKKFVVQNFGYYKKTVFYQQDLSSEVLSDIQSAFQT